MVEQKLAIKTFSANLQLNSKSLFKNFVSTNVCTEIWLDMSHINMKSSEWKNDKISRS